MQSSYSLVDFFNKQLKELKNNSVNEYKQKSEMIIDAVLGIKKAELYTNNYSISENQIEQLEKSFSL